MTDCNLAALLDVIESRYSEFEINQDCVADVDARFRETVNRERNRRYDIFFSWHPSIAQDAATCEAFAMLVAVLTSENIAESI